MRGNVAGSRSRGVAGSKGVRVQRMTSLASRLLVAVVGITAGTVAVAAVGLWLTLHAVLLADADRDLDGRAERLRRMDEMSSRMPWRFPSRPWGRPEGRPDGRPDGKPDGRGDPRHLMQMLDHAGVERFRSEALAEGDTLLPAPPLRPANGLRWTVRTTTGATARVLAVTVTRVPPWGSASSSEPAGGLMLLGTDLSDDDRELHRLAWALAGMWLLAIALAGGAALVLRRAVLRPLARLDADLAQLGPEDLTARLPGGTGPTETTALVSRINGLLSGLEGAFRREQATIANLAHELRTPVAGLRSELEFRLLAAQDPAELTVLRTLLGTVARMQAMVSNILMLARIEAGREVLQRSEVDVVPLVEAAVERWEPRAAARGLEFTITGCASLVRNTSASHLDVVLDNLLGNAVAHASDGPLTVTVGDGHLTVTNLFIGSIATEQLGTAFYRADDARSDSAHCGLGLALCRRIAGLLGATIRLEAADGLFVAEVMLPKG